MKPSLPVFNVKRGMLHAQDIRKTINGEHSRRRKGSSSQLQRNEILDHTYPLPSSIVIYHPGSSLLMSMVVLLVHLTFSMTAWTILDSHRYGRRV